MRALVTGAAGFVGAAVVRELLRASFEVRALVRSGGDTRNLEGLDVELAEGDVRDFDAVSSSLRSCQYVFHLAAFYSESDSDSEQMYDVNVEGTKTLLKAARGGNGRYPDLEALVHTSTIGTIGRASSGTLPGEDSQFNLWESSSHYVRSKYLGEQAASSAWLEGLPVIVVHPGAPVGVGDIKPTVTGRRIVDFLQGRMPSYVQGGINFVGVDDVARGHLLAARKGRPGLRYILGNRNLNRDDFLSLLELVSGQSAPRTSSRDLLVRIRRRLQRSAAASASPGGPAALACDCSRSVQELGLPQTPLELSMEQAVNWFRQRGYASVQQEKRWTW